jgi:hypothetical protein
VVDDRTVKNFVDYVSTMDGDNLVKLEVDLVRSFKDDFKPSGHSL